MTTPAPATERERIVAEIKTVWLRAPGLTAWQETADYILSREAALREEMALMVEGLKLPASQDRFDIGYNAGFVDAALNIRAGAKP